MRGAYQMVRDDGAQFEAEIAPFTLEMPHSLN
jgi:ApaG protein